MVVVVVKIAWSELVDCSLSAVTVAVVELAIDGVPIEEVAATVVSAEAGDEFSLEEVSTKTELKTAAPLVSAAMELVIAGALVAAVDAVLDTVIPVPAVTLHTSLSPSLFASEDVRVTPSIGAVLLPLSWPCDIVDGGPSPEMGSTRVPVSTDADEEIVSAFVGDGGSFLSTSSSSSDLLSMKDNRGGENCTFFSIG